MHAYVFCMVDLCVRCGAAYALCMVVIGVRGENRWIDGWIDEWVIGLDRVRYLDDRRSCMKD